MVVEKSEMGKLKVHAIWLGPGATPVKAGLDEALNEGLWQMGCPAIAVPGGIDVDGDAPGMQGRAATAPFIADVEAAIPGLEMVDLTSRY